MIGIRCCLKIGCTHSFDKKLLFFLPFYKFSHDKELPDCATDETKLEMLKGEYRLIRTRLDKLQKTGEISGFTKSAICAMINHVMALIAEKYQNVREDVEYIMGGKVLEYEAKTIRDEERKKAMTETEERAKDMLRDRMDFSIIEKYTHLSMPRIQELARGLGML